jgi:hypothetical protein
MITREKRRNVFIVSKEKYLDGILSKKYTLENCTKVFKTKRELEETLKKIVNRK